MISVFMRKSLNMLPKNQSYTEKLGGHYTSFLATVYSTHYPGLQMKNIATAMNLVASKNGRENCNRARGKLYHTIARTDLFCC